MPTLQVTKRKQVITKFEYLDDKTRCRDNGMPCVYRCSNGNEFHCSLDAPGFAETVNPFFIISPYEVFFLVSFID